LSFFHNTHPSQDCVNKTIARIRQKLEKDDRRVLRHVTYGLRSSDRAVTRAVAMSLAQLAPTGELRSLFVDMGALDVLLALVTDRSTSASACEQQQ
jgi:hypothetical protein